MKLNGTYRWKPYAEMPEHLRKAELPVLLWCDPWPEASAARFDATNGKWFLLDEDGYMTCDPDYYCEMIEPPRTAP
jgi:hypothetical protein